MDYETAKKIVENRYNAVSYRLMVRISSLDAATRFPIVDPANCCLYLVPADHSAFANICGMDSGDWFETLDDSARKACIYLGDLASAYDKVAAFRSAFWTSHTADRALLNAVPPSDSPSDS